MVMPRLLNPINVQIQKTDKAATPQDHLRREPINRIVRTTVYTFKAQVQWAPGETGAMNYPTGQAQGVGDSQQGYLILLVRDLAAQGYEPTRGDKIIKIGPRNVQLYLTDSTPHSHYADQGDFTLLRVWFQDRAVNP